ncbi:hypothetical protein ACFSL4_31505 [Streptomyces caeni]|uniref:Uncharacterized protein n=1 Tax=Streptomyces caeni TaxID=2307231 RepID=A0ABW4J262_9ACTN
MRRPRRLRAALPAVALLVGLTAGCARDHHGAATTSPSPTPSGLVDLQKKVAAAESALAAADRDAAREDDR